MSKSVRLSEKWFSRILWLVAFMFTWFLLGLGSQIVKNMPKLGAAITEEQFITGPRYAELKVLTVTNESHVKELNDQRALASIKLQETSNAYKSARDAYQNWLASRSVTKRSEQDPEVIKRVHELDKLKHDERTAQSKVEELNKALVLASQEKSSLQSEMQSMRASVESKFLEARRKNELNIFLYRLAFTLPLLVLAGWLFKTRRKSTYWPFVMGFTIFAVITFFVELVPYMPNYGGFVRSIVGILITVVSGRYAVQALQRYREQQAIAEKEPDEKRRSELSYDVALARLAKNVCPGCERPVDLGNEQLDYCHHCGIALHNKCIKCNHRKSAFSKFCMRCGESSTTNN